MSYSFESRVRYSEIGENGRLSLPGILNYFQDSSTFHSESVGLGVKGLKERKRVWVLSAWQVVVNRYPSLGEHVIITTFPYDFKGFMGMRNFYMDTKDGERLAYANTYWSYLNVETGLPAKLEPEDTAGYEIEPRLSMEYAPRKIKLPETWQEKESFAVQKHHLDTNHHVNNCQYISMAQDYLPGDFLVRQMRAEYKMQGRLGDVFYPRVSREDGRITVVLEDENQKPYVIVEFQS